MSIIKCKMCGGDLNIIEGASTAECEFCGSVQTLPKANDEVIQNLFNRANNLRIKCEFDKAEQIYEKILQENDVRLTEHCFYTDQEYDLLPLPWVDTVRVFPEVVYCYRIGRGEQSVSPEGLEKHYNDQTVVLKRLYTIYPQVGKKKTAKDKYIFNYFVLRTFLQIRVLLVISKSALHKQELINFVRYLKREQPLIYKELLRTSKILKLLLITRFNAYGILHERLRREYRY